MIDSKKVWSLFDEFRGEIPAFELSILVMQILFWKKLSDKGLIGESQSFDSFYENDLSSYLLEKAFMSLSKEHPAFANIPISNRITDSRDGDLIARLFYRINEIEGIEYNLIIDIWASIKDITEYSIPTEFCDLFDQIGSQTDYETVYNPDAKSFELALHFAKKSGKQVFCEQAPGDINIASTIPELLNGLYDTNIVSNSADFLTSPTYKKNQHRLEAFDLVVTTSNMGKRVPSKANLERDPYYRFRFSEKDYESAIIEHCLSQTAKRALILVSSGFLSRTISKEKMLKNYLVEEGLIEAIIAFPTNSLNRTSANSNLLVINKEKRHKEILMLDASTYFRNDVKTRKNVLIGSKEVSEIVFEKKVIQSTSCIIPADDIASKNFNLLPGHYVLSPEEDKVHRILSSIPAVRLEDIAEIIRPQNIRPAQGNASELFSEVVVGDIPDGGFICIKKEEKERKPVDKIDVPKARRSLLKPYDILLSIKGNTGIVGVMGDKIPENSIANQMFTILRLHKDPKNNAVYLYMYLKSSLAQTVLNHVTIKGTTLDSIPAQAIADLKIPAFSEEQKNNMFRSFENIGVLCDRVNSIKKEISDKFDDFVM